MSRSATRSATTARAADRSAAVTEGARLLACALGLAALLPRPAAAYSVLSHEALVDAAWEASLRPALLARFPGASAEDLRRARAYAYGGSLIQDMGYYPFGNKLFSDLTHYVRSGGFLEALLRESKDLDEYAFALGALSHYSGDDLGHALATNRSVPLLFPKLRAQYGREVAFADDPTAHIRVEFGFDVVQVARGQYASRAYHDFIGFEVSKPVLGRAFKATYGVDLKDIFRNLDAALASYRKAVSTTIPQLTKVAWREKHDQIHKLVPGATRAQFVYSMTRGEYKKEWGNEYRVPLFGRILGFLVRVLPKVGPLRAASPKIPTPEAERLFLESFDAAVEDYRALLRGLAGLDLGNPNLDLGRPSRAGEYRLADEAYSRLLDKLGRRDFAGVGPELRQDILRFYADPEAPVETRRTDPARWRRNRGDLERLRALSP
jgi:zinc dependent phospholipase C